MRVRLKRLGPVRRPFHRPARHFRRPQHQHVLVIDGRFHAVGTADVAGNDAHLAFRHADHLLRDVHPIWIGVLQRGVDRIAVVGRIVIRQRRARFDRRGRDPVDDKFVADDAIRFLKRRVGGVLVTDQMNEGDVVGRLVPHQRRAVRDSAFGIGNCRQWIVIDDNQLRCIGRLRLRLCDHERNAVADATHPVRHQGRKRRCIGCRAVPQLSRRIARHIAPAKRLPVGAGQHREHTRRSLCGGRVDGQDLRMRMGGAQDHAVHHSRQRPIVGEPATAPQQARIFRPRHGLSKCVFPHDFQSRPAARTLHAPVQAIRFLL